MYADNRKLVEKIAQLEEQLRRHQVLAEQLGDPSAVDQMKVQVNFKGLEVFVCNLILSD